MSTELESAHPRSRGENWVDHTLGIYSLGLIPAHAGKTGGRAESGCARRAHPRSRGENIGARNASAFRPGSSPLTRGKPGNGRSNRSRRRLIPAHAGKTSSRVSDVNTVTAHPRSRGENDTAEHELRAAQGSSPLTRGKRRAPTGSRRRRRLIPAHAGKTVTSEATPGAALAHPRSRGENHHAPARAHEPTGSSPLTRGKPDLRTNAGGGERLIPAHAGKTG